MDVLKYRDGSLYDKLLKIDEKGVNGIKYQTKRRFEFILQTIITTWLTYDLSLIKNRFDNNLYSGYKTLENNLKTFKKTYNVGYSVTSAATAENKVRVELKSRNVGSITGRFNHKMIGQLYIS